MGFHPGSPPTGKSRKRRHHTGKPMTFSHREKLQGMTRHRISVLVPIVLTLTVILGCISGCIGVAQPHPQLGAAQIAVAPNSFSMNAAAVGSSSSQVATVTNVGTSSAGISQATVSGAGFSIAGLALPITLSPGQSASFTVKFTAATLSTVDGSISIATDAQHQPVLVRLHGTAGPAAPMVSSVTLSSASRSMIPGGKMQLSASVLGSATD